MQSYYYLNKERVYGAYAQLAEGYIAKKNIEKTKKYSGRFEANLLAFLKGSGGNSCEHREATEIELRPENMIRELIKIVPESSDVKRVVEQEDWAFVFRGDLIVFKGEFKFMSFNELEKRNSYFILKGTIGEKEIEVPFSDAGITSETIYTILNKSNSLVSKFELEGVGYIVCNTDAPTIIIQPLAFGHGFLT